MMGIQTVAINTATPYHIHIGTGLLPQAGAYISRVLPGAKLAVITDDTVHALYAQTLLSALHQHGFETALYVFPHGENAKCQERLAEIYAFLARNALTRCDAVVALGGGVTGDLAGYAAATWLRGIPYVQIPTTFLAAIDSSVGGKTAINIPQGKNLIGAFWQPRLVLCDSQTLSTLTPDIFGDGVAEAVKYGALYDETLFAQIAQGNVREHLEAVILRCVELKRRVVEADEHDTAGRQLLNFGHTLGHAIEHDSHLLLSHGKAVGIGMVEITRRTEKLGLTHAGCAQRIADALEAYDMQTRYSAPLHTLLPTVLGDKKRLGEKITFVVLKQIGEAYLHPVSTAQLDAFIG